MYNILIFGDRKDEIAMADFNKYGVEYPDTLLHKPKRPTGNPKPTKEEVVEPEMKKNNLFIYI